MADFLDYLPSVLREFKEFQAIAEAENPEIVEALAAIENIMNDQFINDATENGVKRWETIMRIVPKGSDDLDVRKFRILTRLNEKLPYTEETLREKLANLCGADGYTLTMNHGTYTMIVRIRLYAISKYDEVDHFLKRTVPANILIDLSMLYNTHAQLSGKTHSQLSAYTHDQLRKEVMN